MKIFMLGITTHNGNVISTYAAMTIAENENDAMVNGFKIAQDQCPTGAHKILVNDVTEYLNLHHVNGEVVK